MNQKIAFVGVGRMGANMARRLKDCGYTISAVFDTYQTMAVSLAAELGCAAPETLAEVTASVVGLVLVDSDEVAD